MNLTVKTNNRASTQNCAFTISSWNYLAHSLTLAESFASNHKNIVFYIFIADTGADVQYDLPDNVSLILLDKNIVPDYYRMAAWYNILEFNTSVKAHCFEFLFDVKGYSRIAYFDPDIYILSDLHTLFDNDLEDYDCVVTPHITKPVSDELFPDDTAFLRAGIYNLGFLGLNNSNASRSFLSWWKSKLETKCFVAIEEGIFVDQKFCDFIPAFIDRVKINLDPGYNLAYWNLLEREIEVKDQKLYASGSVIKFVHFSGIDINQPEIFSKHQNRFTRSNIGCLRDVYDQYLILINDRKEYFKNEYGFDKLSDGTKIIPAMRLCFRKYWTDIKNPNTPFIEGLNFFTKPSNLTKSYTNIHVNRLIAEIFQSRKDLIDTFDLSQDSGRMGLNNWARDSIEREYFISSDYAKCQEYANYNTISASNPPRQDASIPDRFNKIKKVIIFYLVSFMPFKAYSSEKLDEIAWNIAYSYELLPLHIRLKALNALNLESDLRRKKLFSYWLHERGIHEIINDFNLSKDNRVEKADIIQSDLAQLNNQSTNETIQGVGIYGFFNTETGVGQAARDLSKAFDKSSIQHSCHAVIPEGYDNSSEFISLNNPSNFYDKSLLILNADNIINLKKFFDPQIISNKYKIGFFFWELPVFPGAWAGACEYLDEIWTPSKFVANSLKSATRKRTNIVPLPVQLNQYDKYVSRKLFGLPEDKLIYLTVFDYNSFPARKNPIATLKAFIDAFPDNNKNAPLLIVKCHGMGNREKYEAQILDIISKAKNIILFDKVMPREELLKLQSACDVFVSLHRSEGFGLNIAECMAASKLTIATNYSGNTDFMNAGNSILVDYSLRFINEGEYIYSEGQVWAEPNHDYAVDALRFAANSETERNKTGHEAYKSIKEKYSYDSIGKSIESYLRDR